MRKSMARGKREKVQVFIFQKSAIIFI